MRKSASKRLRKRGRDSSKLIADLAAENKKIFLATEHTEHTESTENRKEKSV
jgi:hypothetical protein